MGVMRTLINLRQRTELLEFFPVDNVVVSMRLQERSSLFVCMHQIGALSLCRNAPEGTSY